MILAELAFSHLGFHLSKARGELFVLRGSLCSAILFFSISSKNSLPHRSVEEMHTSTDNTYKYVYMGGWRYVCIVCMCVYTHAKENWQISMHVK